MSRRQFARNVAVASATALVVPALTQEAKKHVPPNKPTAAELAVASELAALEAKLEKPLPTKLKGPAKAALANIRQAAAERRKFSLPEGSEPCTLFVPIAKKAISR